MRSRATARWTLVVATALMTVVGCGGGSIKTSLVYTLPPQRPVPARVKEVAVVKFTALQSTEETYGEVAASRLNESLLESGRYKMYERRDLARVIEEQDFRESGLADPGKMRTKLPSVDAIITGHINAGGQYGTETKQQFDLATQTMKTVTVRYVVCEATVSFRMLDVNTGGVLATASDTAKYDSRKRSPLGAVAGMVGVPTGGRLPTPQSKLPELIAVCVDRLAAKIAPYKVNVPLKLKSGRSDFVKRGNKFAEVGQWKDAERLYRQGIAADVEGKDDDAHFNLGVALEAQGRLAEAATEYKNAIDIDDDDRYFQALARVRRLGGLPE